MLKIIHVASGKEGSKDDVVMVDLVEAKRVAAKQMKKIKANEKFMVKAILCLNLNHVHFRQVHRIAQVV